MPRNDKGNWNGAPAVPTYRGNEKQESARYLATVCRRFLADRASEKDVNEAIAVWQHFNILKDNAKT